MALPPEIVIVIEALRVGGLGFGEAVEMVSFRGVKECVAEEHVSWCR